jgi:hypothetical protein
MLAWLGVAAPLFVGLQEEEPRDTRSAGALKYCPEVRGDLRDWLLRSMR